jgi:hypothetical protein
MLAEVRFVVMIRRAVISLNRRHAAVEPMMASTVSELLIGPRLARALKEASVETDIV